MVCSSLAEKKAVNNVLLGWSLSSGTLVGILGTLRNHDGDGDGNVCQKAIGLASKTTTLHVHHAFLYISLPSLHDYDLK